MEEQSRPPWLVLIAGSIPEVVRELRRVHGTAVNLIESEERVEINQPTSGPDVQAVLDALVARSDRYRRRRIRGRDLIYPTDPVWECEVSGIAITGVPRLDAATQFVVAVNSQIPALKDLLPPPILGDPRTPAHVEPVSLQPEAVIVEHLAELLGTNEQIVFTIEWALSGQRMLHFEQVMPRQESGSEEP